MIEELEKHEPNPKVKVDPETLTYLEGLPWRPIGIEW